jgi:imidazolonepropionase-like amidohydrolase
LLLFALAPHAQTPHRLALVGGMLLTGYEVPPIHHAAVLVEGNTIVQAGPASEVKIPADATVVDTSGRTMLPGLIETHGHLIVLGHGNYATWFTWINSHGGRQMLMKVMETSAKQLLMAGVTTEVDLGAPLADSLAIRDRIRKGEVVGPRVFVSGPWIAHLSAAAAGDAMQVGFGGINTSTPAEAAQQAERLAAAGLTDKGLLPRVRGLPLIEDGQVEYLVRAGRGYDDLQLYGVVAWTPQGQPVFIERVSYGVPEGVVCY